MKTLATILIVLCGFICSCSNESGAENLQNKTITVDQQKFEQAQAKTEIPNLISISGKGWEPIFVSPNGLMPWIYNNLEKANAGINYGQICVAIAGDQCFAFTAPHVISDANQYGGYPKSEFLGPWINSPHGHEVCFAKISDWKKFGFIHEPKKIAKAKIGEPATLKATCINPQNGEVLDIFAEGVLQSIDGSELKKMADAMNQGSAIRDRLENRAPKERILYMGGEPHIDPLLKGCSGALVWQDGNPVGVFVAKYSDGGPVALIIEPIEDVFKSK